MPACRSPELAFAWVQMQRQPEGGKPVNPFPAIYYTAQRAPDLINGAQQDIHEDADGRDGKGGKDGTGGR